MPFDKHVGRLLLSCEKVRVEYVLNIRSAQPILSQNECLFLILSLSSAICALYV